ncbi:MAG: hypothetical protein RBU25_11885, partial [Lentisphaeria bacterium]|nr:hypothetical protein [Lentisphaeria bacterium]
PAWLWTHTITADIRNEDSTRPVASGMHGLYPGSEREFGGGKGFSWTIRDQGSLCDLMSSHPYPHSPSKKPARVDRVGSLRSNFQAVVESRLYADLGGKPCLVEEIGTFGPMVCDEARQASFIRSVLWNTWAHDCRGLLWWCGFEQADLEQSPYDWNAWERELGLFRRDLSPKPVAAELGTFRRLLDNLPPLPPFRRDAVCLLPRELSPEDYLENAWSCFLLAKQAGFDLEFHYADDPLRDSSLYLIPGVKGQGGLSRHLWLELMERASAGATVFLSLDSGHLSPFSECFGLRVRNREAREGGVQFAFAGQTFSCRSPYRLELVPEGAEILAAEPDGNPVLSRFRRGRGTIWLLTCPVESHLAGKPGAFAPGAPPFWRIYQAVAETALVQRLVRRREPQLTLTEHLLAPNQAVALLYNHLETELEDELTLAPGWRIVEALPESGLQGGTRVRLPAGSGLILRLTADTRTRSRE